MNRKHQGNQTRNWGAQSSKGRAQEGFDQDFEDTELERFREFGASTNRSRRDDAYEASRSSNFRDADYDMEGAVYDRSARTPAQRGMSAYDNFETHERNRNPSRYSSLDENPTGMRRAFEKGLERSQTSKERFGYPSNMESWNHRGDYDRYEYNSGVGRMGHPEWRSADYDNEAFMGGSYGEGSLERGYDARPSYAGKGPKGYKRSDERIKEDVCETLARNPRIDASDIEVKVEDACVMLSGTVPSKEIKRAAEMSIENLPGVEDVKNEIRIKRTDESFLASAGNKNATKTTGTSKSSGHM